jgi:hypothetical protein
MDSPARRRISSWMGSTVVGMWYEIAEESDISYEVWGGMGVMEIERMLTTWGRTLSVFMPSLSALVRCFRVNSLMRSGVCMLSQGSQVSSASL